MQLKPATTTPTTHSFLSKLHLLVLSSFSVRNNYRAISLLRCPKIENEIFLKRCQIKICKLVITKCIDRVEQQNIKYSTLVHKHDLLYRTAEYKIFCTFA